MVKDTKLYDRLEIQPDADETTIKKAYNKLSKIYHPDKISDDKKEEYTQKFKEITEAKEILLDDNKRNNYDQFGLDNLGQPQQPPQPNINPFDIFANFGGIPINIGGFNFSHSFSHNFSNQPKKDILPENISHKINVTLDQIYNEETINFTYNYNLSCPTCGFRDIKCNDCNGSGRIERRFSPAPNMIQTISSTCGACCGRGEINSNTNCNDCNNQSYIVKERTIGVPLKSNVLTKNVIEITGKGHHIRNNKSNLEIEVNILPHTVFKKNINSDLFIEIELKLYQALFGFDKEIQHMDKRKLHINSKTKTLHNTIKKITGEGMKLIDSDKKGDLYIRFSVNLPNIDNYTNEDKEKIHKYMKLLDKHEVLTEMNLLKNENVIKTHLHDCKNIDEISILFNNIK